MDDRALNEHLVAAVARAIWETEAIPGEFSDVAKQEYAVYARAAIAAMQQIEGDCLDIYRQGYRDALREYGVFLLELGAWSDETRLNRYCDSRGIDHLEGRT